MLSSDLYSSFCYVVFFLAGYSSTVWHYPNKINSCLNLVSLFSGTDVILIMLWYLSSILMNLYYGIESIFNPISKIQIEFNPISPTINECTCINKSTYLMYTTEHTKQDSKELSCLIRPFLIKSSSFQVLHPCCMYSPPHLSGRVSLSMLSSLPPCLPPCLSVVLLSGMLMPCCSWEIGLWVWSEAGQRGAAWFLSERIGQRGLNIIRNTALPFGSLQLFPNLQQKQHYWLGIVLWGTRLES